MTPSPAILLDSSVLVKWYAAEEEDTEIALLLREQHLHDRLEIRLADVSFYEFANALHYSGTYTTKDIIQSIQTVLALELQVYQFDLLALRAALDLCAAKKIAIYDAYLVALAKRENLVFVTADSKLLRKLGKTEPALSLRQFTKLLADTQD